MGFSLSSNTFAALLRTTEKELPAFSQPCIPHHATPLPVFGYSSCDLREAGVVA